MEELNLIDDTSMEGGFNAEIKTYMMETAKWAKFIAIVSLVFGGLMTLAAIFSGSVFGALAQQSGIPFGMGFIVIIYLGSAAMIIIPNVFLLNFASKAITSLRSGNETDLTLAFRNLKSYYKFIGILTAIFIGIYALILIFGVFGGLLYRL
ncbi:MAG: hypothetical protein KDC85_10715 [Saprospiraceae bacterium]|nr:hypothetical protein [Saprospiraceae bacterium]MCB9323452.1 hypothetical protein [Lewinellaceae bacterium]